MSDDNLMAPPRRLSLSLGNGEISYLEWKLAEGLPPLHFAHANGFNGLTYRALLAPLAPYFHIRAWDARGHGMTTLPADPAAHKDWYIYRDDLIAFTERFAEDAGRPVLLAGHSMGGTASLMAAAERPDLVAGLCLADPVLIPASMRRLLRLAGRFGFKLRGGDLAAGAEKRRARWKDKETIIAAYKGRGAFRTWPTQFLADYVEGGTKPAEDGEVELACAPAWEAANFRAQRHDPWAAIEKLRVPLTLLYAGKGSTCSPPGPQLLARKDPGATVARVGEATHFLPMEFPERLRQELLSLEARVERAARA